MTRFAIQGIRGSYSEEAAFAFAGGDAVTLECSSFDAVVAAVYSGEADLGVLPIKNSIVGDILPTHVLIAETDPETVDHIDIRVEHILAGRKGAATADIRSIVSHPEALRQCSRFFRDNRHIEQIAGGDTASSVRSVVSDYMRDRGAICSERAAVIHGADVLARGIADADENYTTFAVIRSRDKRNA